MSVQPTITIAGGSEFQRGRLAGWREGYAAAQQDMAQRGALQPEVVDAMVIERLTQLLGQLRGQAAA
jgi:hypothetical protein